jgi:hypothetical protein
MLSTSVQNRSAGLTGTGVLADRALLVVTEYLRSGKLPEDGTEILTRFRDRYEEAKAKASRPGLRSGVTSSLDVVATSERALRSLPSAHLPKHGTVPSLDHIFATLDELRVHGHADPEDVRMLQAFLNLYGEYTLTGEARQQLLRRTPAGSPLK